MSEQTTKVIAARITAVIIVLIVIAFYLFPWLLPLFYDMPEGTTLPYYAILVAVEMAPHVHQLKRSGRDNRKTNSEG